MSRTYNVWTLSYTDLAGDLLAGTVKGYFVTDQTAEEALLPAGERRAAIAHFPVTSRYAKKGQYQRAVLFCNYLNRDLDPQQADIAGDDTNDTDILRLPHTAEANAAAVLETMRVIGRLHRGVSETPMPKKNVGLVAWLKRCIPGRVAKR